MLQTGIKGYQEIIVTEEDTAKAHRSGTMEVLATPRMAALMEETAWKSVAGDKTYSCFALFTQNKGQG